MQTDSVKQAIREFAAGHGFDLCHVSRPEVSAEHGRALDAWLGKGMQGDMAWMNVDERVGRQKHPAAMLAGVRSVISVAMRHTAPPYTLQKSQQDRGRGVIASYAHGDDYHEVMKRRLKALARDLDALLGRHEQRVYVDTAPVLEHALAENAGLAWQGRHSLSLNRQLGSWFFLGELFTTADIEPDDKASFHCGTCRACMDICPTGAIVAPFVVDARLCISYLSIEHKGFIPRALRGAMGNRIYGCDDCQMVCPWNGDLPDMSTDHLSPRGENCLPALASLLALDDAAFRARFAKSPVKRLGRERFLRNVCVAAGNSGDAALLGALWPLLADASPLVRGHAAWAVGRLGGIAESQTASSRLSDMWAGETDRQVLDEIDQALQDIACKDMRTTA